MNFALQEYHNEDLERGMISCLLSDHGAILQAIDAGVSDTDFYNIRYRICWQSAHRAYSENKVWDLLVLNDDIKGKIDNSLLWSSDIFKVTESAYHIKEYSERLRKLAMRRDGLLFAERTANNYAKWDNDIIDVHRVMVTEATTIGEKLAANATHVMELATESEDHYLKVMRGEVPPALGDTPFADLNRSLSPFTRGQMIVIAAREKSGKTRWMLQELDYLAASGLKSLYISCEMRKGALWQTMSQMHARVSATRAQTFTLSDYERDAYFSAMHKLRGTPIYFEDRTRDIASIRNLCLKTKHSTGLDVVFVDYLTKIQNNNPNLHTRQQQIAEITATLAYIAIECDCLLFLGSQVNAEGNTREAMDTQQDADKIIKLKRLSRDGQFMSETDIDLTQREGNSFSSGFIKLRFNTEYACYENMAKETQLIPNDMQDKTNAGF